MLAHPRLPVEDQPSRSESSGSTFVALGDNGNRKQTQVSVGLW
jgi:hypothetical protein